MADENVEQLLREGVAAARTGDKVTARDKLQQVVALDPQSEKGWFWLASVVETDEEKRVCLGNVIVINPGNNRAKQLLEDMDRVAAGENEESEGSKEGGNKRQLLIIGGVGAVLIIVVLLFFLPRGGDSVASVPTTVAPASTTGSDSTGSVQAVALEGSPSGSPSAALPDSRATLPPTWTSQPTFTSAVLQTATPLATPPASLTGHLLILNGTVLNNFTFPIFSIDPSGQNKTQVIPEENRGDFAIFEPGGRHIIFSRYYGGTDAIQFSIVNPDGSDPHDGSVIWGNKPPLADQQMPAIARDGKAMVFSASNVVENDQTAGIFYVPYVYSGKDTPPQPLSRVTAKDDGENTWPTISPDGKLVVYVKKGPLPSGNTGTDLILAALNGAPLPGGSAGGNPGKGKVATQAATQPSTQATGDGSVAVQPTQISATVQGAFPPVVLIPNQIKALTTDGNTLIEAAPEFSPDGKQIAFQASKGQNQPSAIFVMNVDGSGRKALIQDSADNIRPHWSPDGKYIAFSSTRSGKWEVFIVEVATGTVYQLTQTKEQITVCTAWD